MNKEETIIGFKEQTGLRISKDNTDITTGKVIVNGIEITSVEDWEKVTKSLVELQQERNNYKELYEKEKGKNEETREDIRHLLDIISCNCKELKCTSDEWMVIQIWQDRLKGEK